VFRGRDMHLFLTKRLLASKTPQLIVLEVNEHEPPYGHLLMPYVASASDMFCCRFWADLNFSQMFLLFLKEQLYGTLSMLWPPAPLSAGPPHASEYGWDPIDRTWDAQTPHNPSLGDRLENLVGGGPRAAAYKLASSFGNQTVRQIVDLAHSSHVKIIFLYLPEYNYAADPRPENIRFYNDMGPVLVPPQNVVANRLNWGDFAHLNKNGAVKLVPHLSAAIADYLVGVHGAFPTKE